MNLETLATERLAHGEAGSAATAATPDEAVPGCGDRSPGSLALALVEAAERVRTDPDENFAHCAVRGAAVVLRARLGERLGGGSPEAAPAPTEGP